MLKKLQVLEKDHQVISQSQNFAMQALVELLTNTTVLNQTSTSMILQKLSYEHHQSPVKSSKENNKDSSVRMFLRGFSMQQKTSPKKMKPLKRESSSMNGADKDIFMWSKHDVNEVRAFTQGIKRIVKALKNFTFKACKTDITSSVEFSSSLTSNYSDASGCGSFEMLNNISSSSDTTGYESRSPSFDNDSIGLKSNRSRLYLPLESDVLMQEVCKVWEFYSRTLQHNKELQDCFAEYGGPDTALKLLNLATVSIVPVRSCSSSDFTTSLNASLVTQVENTDTASVTNDVKSDSQNTTESKSITLTLSNQNSDSSNSQSTFTNTFLSANNLSNSDHQANKETIKTSSSLNFVDSDPAGAGANHFAASWNFEEHEHMEFKLRLLSATLNISLISTTINSQEVYDLFMQFTV